MLKLAPGESNVIDFGAVVPGESQESVILVASRVVNVTARIDRGGGRFRIITVECVEVSSQPLTPEEIEQLPPDMQKDPRFHVTVVRTVIGTSDGTTPLTVQGGQEVIVRVAFQGEDNAVEGLQSATLIISGSDDPILIPMSALVGRIEADLPTSTLSITQGGAALLSVTLRSTFGPGTTVRLEMDTHSGLSMHPVSVSVLRGGQAKVSLILEADRFAPPIGLRKELRISAFDGRQIMFLPVLCQILPAPPPPPSGQPPAPTAPEVKNISLRYVGFHCFGETNELSGSDEPYFTFGVVPMLVGLRMVKQTIIYDDVDAGRSVSDRIELYKGPALGAAISITLAEHDEGNPETYRENVDKAVDAAAAKVVEGLGAIPVVGAPLAVLGQIAFIIAGPAITDAVNELLGTEDDHIGTVGLVLTPEDMLRLSQADRQDFHGIKAHLESPLISGDGSSYKVYFDVTEV